MPTPRVQNMLDLACSRAVSEAIERRHDEDPTAFHASRRITMERCAFCGQAINEARAQLEESDNIQ